MSAVARNGAPLVVLLLAACGAPLPPLPQIAIDGCDLTAAPKPDGDNGFDDDTLCHLDFGARDMSVVAQRAVVVSNPSDAILTLTNVEVIGDPSFKIDAAPSRI